MLLAAQLGVNSFLLRRRKAAMDARPADRPTVLWSSGLALRLFRNLSSRPPDQMALPAVDRRDLFSAVANKIL